MKPKLLSDVLRQSSPRKFLKGNPYAVLRDVSPAGSTRSSASTARSIPVKRKHFAGDSGPLLNVPNSYAAIASGTHVLFPEEVTEEIVKVKSICEKVVKDLSMDGLDPKLVTIFSSINEAVYGVCKNQQRIVDHVNKVNSNNKPSAANPPQLQGNKKSRQDDEPVMVDLATISQGKQVYRPTEDPKVKRFKDAIRDAEKSTLIFNLNLGKVPMINQDTMSTRVTVALTEMAAAVDESQGNVPSEDTMSAIDDVLSVAKGMKFYGKATKSFKSNKDPRSGSYCTIPVRYDFGDADTRIFAENILKEKCKVQCSTPYPAVVRECIKQLVDNTKVEYPDNFVRVAVDTGNMCFKVYRRKMVDKNYRGRKEWFTVDDAIPIPPEALDLSLRRAPEGFVLPHLQGKKNHARSSTSDSDMETGDSQNTGAKKKQSPKKK
jgi:hypothetical protein